MKKTSLIVASALIVVVCSVIIAGAEPGVQNGDSLSIVEPAGGAYVIVTELEVGVLDFKYGWNNTKHFENPPVGYWIGVYDNTDLHYEWVEAPVFTQAAPKMLKSWSLDTPLISGHGYIINFFVRYTYSPTVLNCAEIQVYFIAP